MKSWEEVQGIEALYGAPFYLLDQERFLDNYRAITRAFSCRYERFILGYSYKTNYIPYLCNLIRRGGGYAEVVSRTEYDLALKIGQDPRKIIFNGPIKSEDDLALALDNGSLVNLDSWYELECVKRYAARSPERTVKVGLRVSMELAAGQPDSPLQGGSPVSRFGFPLTSRPGETPSVSAAIQALQEQPNLMVNGLHGHTSTSSKSLEVFEKITRTLCELAERYLRPSIEYIDVGGGIYGHIPPAMRWKETPDFDAYAATICGVMQEHAWVREQRPTLILEPGVAMAADVLSFVARVVEVKIINGRRLVVVDGSVFHVKPSLHQLNQSFRVLTKRPGGPQETVDVVGNTCMEKDCLLSGVVVERIERGDYIQVAQAGAYTIVMAPPFIHCAPPIVVRDDAGYQLIRKRQSLEEMFGNYVF